MTPEQQRTVNALNACMQITGPRQVICRPLLENVPEFEGAEETVCPVCGRPCWKTPLEPDAEDLPPGVTAACTACALRAGMKRAAR